MIPLHEQAMLELDLNIREQYGEENGPFKIEIDYGFGLVVGRME